MHVVGSRRKYVLSAALIVTLLVTLLVLLGVLGIGGNKKDAVLQEIDQEWSLWLQEASGDRLGTALPAWAFLDSNKRVKWPFQRQRYLDKKGNGWLVTGALVESQQEGDVSYELYLRESARWKAGLVDNYISRENTFFTVSVVARSVIGEGRILFERELSSDDVEWIDAVGRHKKTPLWPQLEYQNGTRKIKLNGTKEGIELLLPTNLMGG